MYSFDATLIYVHIMMDEAVVPSQKPVHPQKPCTFQARAKIGSRRAFLGLFSAKSGPVQARAPVERWERSFRVPARSARRFRKPAEVVCLEMPSIETSEACTFLLKTVPYKVRLSSVHLLRQAICLLRSYTTLWSGQSAFLNCEHSRPARSVIQTLV